MAGGRVGSRGHLLIIVPEECEEVSAHGVEIVKWSTVLRQPKGLFKGYGFIACLPCRFDHTPRMRNVRDMFNELYEWMTGGGTLAFLRPPATVADPCSDTTDGPDHCVSRDETEILVRVLDPDYLPYPGSSTTSDSPAQPYSALPSELQAAVTAWIENCTLDYGVPVFSPPTSMVPLVVFEGDHLQCADLVLAAHARPLGDGLLVLLPSPTACLQPMDAEKLRDLLNAIRGESRPVAPMKPRRGAPRRPDSQHRRIRDFIVEDDGAFSVKDLGAVPELADIKEMRLAADKAVREFPNDLEKVREEGTVLYRPRRPA